MIGQRIKELQVCEAIGGAKGATDWHYDGQCMG